MMESMKFIIQELNHIHTLINSIGFRYAYDLDVNYHVIEVYPVEIYDSNEEYIKLEMDFKERFQRLFPTENIVVSTDREIHDMKNLIYSVCPENKISFNSVNQDDYNFDSLMLFSSCKKNNINRLAA